MVRLHVVRVTVGEDVLLSVTGRPNVQSDNGRRWFYEYEAPMPTADFDDSSGSWEVSDGDSLADLPIASEVQYEMLFHNGALYNNLGAALDIIRCKDGQMPLDHECFANGAFRVANPDECAAVCSAILECHNFEVQSRQVCFLHTRYDDSQGQIVAVAGRDLYQLTARAPPPQGAVLGVGSFDSVHPWESRECRGRNVIMQNGHAYKTLDDAAVDGEAGCQNGYHTIPHGWQIAPHDSDTTTVIAAHTWSTSIVIVVDGSGWYSRYIHTTAIATTASEYSGCHNGAAAGCLSQQDDTYKPRSCSMRILLRCG